MIKKQNNKRVAVLLTSEPISGGEHQYLLLLAQTLKKCDKKYLNVIWICCNRYWENWCRKNGTKYIKFNLKYYNKREMYLTSYLAPVLKYFSTHFTELGRIILKNNIKLIICGQQSIYIPKYLCKNIRPVHDIMHRYESNFEEIRRDYDIREAIFRAGSRVEDAVLVDSKLGKKHFMDCYYRKKNNPKIYELPFVASESILNAVEEKINTPPKYIFYPAQFWEHKNHKNLIKAIALLKNRISDIYLILVGSERNSMAKIKEYIAANGINEYISIQGFVSDGQMKYLYKNAVALVMPTYFGPTNIPPLEAMVLGCPAIVSDKYAMKEQIGNAGLLCNPDSPESIADCILQVWNNEELRQNMVKRGYEQSQKWTINDFKKCFFRIVWNELNR